MNVSTEELMVRQVSAMVTAMAEVIHDDPKEQLELEAHLYHALAVNCQQKAEMTESILKRRTP